MFVRAKWLSVLILTAMLLKTLRMFKITMPILLKQKFYKKVYIKIIWVSVLLGSLFIEVKSKQPKNNIGCPGCKKRSKISFGGKY